MMNRILIFFMILPLVVSCERNPVAGFYCNTVEPEVGQEVLFTNESHNAVDFEWDFGDGQASNDENPVHVYTGTGTYDVTLKAYSKKGLADEAVITITVMAPTLLEIEVREYYEEYIVPGASVYLYETLPDWEEQTNREAEGVTDEYGIVVFSHLGPFVYYVDVWEQNHNNYQLKEENVEYIRTDEVIPHRINRFLAYVDVVDNGKGPGERCRSVVIHKPRGVCLKAPRRSVDAATTGWEELYKRSVKVR
jgi:PKD repeat protein